MPPAQGYPRPDGGRPGWLRGGGPPGGALQRPAGQPAAGIDLRDQPPGLGAAGRAGQRGRRPALPVLLQLQRVRPGLGGRVCHRRIAAQPADALRHLQGAHGRRRGQTGQRWPSRPVFLRNATVYGWSPRFRSDLVLNNLAGWALHHRGDPHPERRHPLAADRPRAGYCPGISRHAGSAPRCDPQPGLQRRRQCPELPGQRAGRDRPADLSGLPGAAMPRAAGLTRAPTGWISASWRGWCRSISPAWNAPRGAEELRRLTGRRS